MQRAATLVLVLGAALALHVSPAAAQPVAGLGEVRTLSSCIHEHQTHLDRLVRLIDEVEARLDSADARVASDARESMTTLLHRAHDVREHLRRCIDSARIPAPAAAVTHVDPPSDSAAESVAGDRGTVHVVERDTVYSSSLRVVRGERVDGTGEAADTNVRVAVRAIRERLQACYDSYVDRVGSERGEVQLVFSLGGGGRASGVAVEAASRFDPDFRSCVQRAGSEIRVADTRGRVTFSYTFRFGPE